MSCRRCQGRRESGRGARLVMRQGECAAKLGLGERRRQVADLLRHHARGARTSFAGERQDVEPVCLRGEVLRLVAGFVGGAGNKLLSVDHRLVGDRRSGVTRAQQELGGIDREPGLRLLRRRPEAEATVETLAIEHEADGLLQAAAPVGAGQRTVRQQGERESAAGGLLQAPQRVAVECLNQPGDVIAHRAAERRCRLPGAGHELVERRGKLESRRPEPVRRRRPWWWRRAPAVR